MIILEHMSQHIGIAKTAAANSIALRSRFLRRPKNVLH